MTIDNKTCVRLTCNDRSRVVSEGEGGGESAAAGLWRQKHSSIAVVVVVVQANAECRVSWNGHVPAAGVGEGYGDGIRAACSHRPPWLSSSS